MAQETTSTPGRLPQADSLPGSSNPRKRRLWLHILLFFLTWITTTLMGGPWYSLSLMAILLFHEMGHYFAARYYGVRATLPYFIPFPTLFGTAGAVIRMEGNIPNRKALFDIGILGPAAGVVVALPVTIIGIYMSEIVAIADVQSTTFVFGESLLFSLITRIIHGPIAEGYDLFLHPIGFAGWAGLLVTALNLLPVGQLDGGHIVYSVFHKHSQNIYRVAFILFALLAVFVSRAWIGFLVLLLLFARLKHPPTSNDSIPIGRRRVIFGISALVFFIATFPPNPITIMQ